MGSLWCWDHREACPEGSAQIRSRRQTSSLTIPEDGSRATRKARPKPNHFLAEARKRGRTGTKTAETKGKTAETSSEEDSEERSERLLARRDELEIRSLTGRSGPERVAGGQPFPTKVSRIRERNVRRYFLFSGGTWCRSVDSKTYCPKPNTVAR